MKMPEISWDGDKPLCPKCGVRMGKAGGHWSGTKKVQGYKCRYGHTWINVKELYRVVQ